MTCWPARTQTIALPKVTGVTAKANAISIWLSFSPADAGVRGMTLSPCVMVCLIRSRTRAFVVKERLPVGNGSAGHGVDVGGRPDLLSDGHAALPGGSHRDYLV
jgi:hypothetical protein